MQLKNVLLIFFVLFLVNCHTDNSLVIPNTDADNGGLFLPEGFGALVVTNGVGESRHIAVNTNGDIYVKLRTSDEIRAMLH